MQWCKKWVLLLCCVLALAVTQCAPSATPTPVVVEKQVTVVVKETVVTEKQPECEKPRYVVTAPLIHPYHTTMQTGAEAAGRDLGVEVIWLTPAEYDVPKQVAMTESALSIPCVEGLAVLAADPLATEGALEEAVKLGISIAQCSACNPDQVAPLCWSTNFKDACYATVDKVVDLLGGKGNVVIAAGALDNVNHNQVRDYYKERLATYPDIKLLDVIQDCDEVEGTVRCAETALAAYPEMNAYMAGGALNAVGAGQVFPEAGRTDIIVQAMDDNPEVMDAIRTGAITFTWMQNPWGQGYLLVWVPWYMRTYGVKPNVKFVDSRIVFVDKSNIDTYQETVRKNFEEVQKYIETEVMQ
ncbi:MAG: substrate-binding domain-containing protein [Anaerolineae bacterium]|nr:substrate-binding domain-containing protein [Anaerolineae bacterium]